jgi:hypothetical protein
MPLKRSTLEALAAPLNRRDFAAFVEAVARLPASDRNILAVLGAGLLLMSPTGSRGYLRSAPTVMTLLADFQRENVDEA